MSVRFQEYFSPAEVSAPAVERGGEIPKEVPSKNELKSELQSLFPQEPIESKTKRTLEEEAFKAENTDTITLDDGTVIHLPDANGQQKADVGAKPEVTESDYLSTYKDRLDRTPNETGDRGSWTGERGESVFIPNDMTMKDLLEQFGLNGIAYEAAIPDFSQCSECTITIDYLSDKRQGAGNNFDQCDHKCAEHWNEIGRDGRNDWTANDVRIWRDENKYSWHERNDMKTCDLIPTKVNDYFGHLGGVGECRRRDAIADLGGEFDVYAETGDLGTAY